MSNPNLQCALDFMAFIEAGDAVGAIGCYDPEGVQIEWPNRLKAGGDRRGIATMAEDFARGQKILRSQRYGVTSTLADGDLVMVEVVWRGVLAVDIASLKAGDEMVAHSAVAFTFRNGKILSQRNYDCFDAF